MAEIQTAVPQQLSMAGPAPLDQAGFEQPRAMAWSGGNWQIVGDDSQALVVVLQSGEEVMCEPGGMLHSTPALMPETDTGGFGLALQRCCCAGESFFRVHYKNVNSTPESISVTPSFPAKVIPLDLNQYSGMMIKKRSYTASIGRNVEFGLKSAPSFLVGCCGGQGCCLTTINGTGMAFLNAGGTVVQRKLAAGESIHVDESSVVAAERTVTMDVKRTGSCAFICCGGMGIFNTVLTGPGLVILQSMSYERAAKAYMGAARGGG